MGWERVCRLEDLPPGARRVIPCGRRGVLVLNVEGRVFAVANECPHLGVGLESAEVQGGELRCREHGYRMELSTGACLTESGLRLPVFAVEVREGWIWVKTRSA